MVYASLEMGGDTCPSRAPSRGQSMELLFLKKGKAEE